MVRFFLRLAFAYSVERLITWRLYLIYYADGKTDATRILQRKINGLAVLNLPPGKFKVSSTVPVPSNRVIRGGKFIEQQQPTTRLRWTPPND